MRSEVTTITYSLEDFGARERGMMMDILQAWDRDGLPSDFHDSRCRIGFNMNSGYVWLENDDCQCAMMNGEKLELFHSLPDSGEEGFLSDLCWHWSRLSDEDQWYLQQFMSVPNGYEVFHDDGQPVVDGDDGREAGWYWWACFPGCLPDGDAVGPFDNEAEALADLLCNE